ncbi:hypothetical protein ABC347_12730 [Sphingomonas sp. 1P06PA]|uniref:hypothetical protein n=1 Tax=Sphingomonas sp. 1P06PA TaxID=554121 RepID=UPI0039A5E8BB
MTDKSLFDRVRAWLGDTGPAPAAPAAAPPAAERAPATPPAPAPSSAPDPDDPRIPDASRAKVRAVLELIADLESRISDDSLAAGTRVDLDQMRSVHMPRLIQSYVDIPAAHRSEIFRRTGRSASYVLNDGLDVMAERLRAMSKSLAQGNIDAFTDNMRFIDSRYGSRSPLD